MMADTPETVRLIREQHAAFERGEREHPLASWARSAEETRQSHIEAQDLYATVGMPDIQSEFTFQARDEEEAQRARALGILAEVSPKIEPEPPMVRVPNRAMRRHPRG